MSNFERSLAQSLTYSSSPMNTLLQLSASSASGEFVCVSPSCELHVYLQSGRVAWATDSTQPFAFSRHLLEHTSLTKDTFNEVLETCRRDRLPLGETLVEWKVVTLDEIRAALHHQIQGALASLSACLRERTIFLERQRQFASYDAKLTFDMGELVEPQTAVRRVLPPTESIAPPSEGVLERILTSIPPPAWAALVDGQRVLDRMPSGIEQLVPQEVLGHTVLDGADLVAVRSGRGTVIGVALPEPSRTVWCQLEVETALGTTLSGLCQYARIPTPSAPPPAPQEGWSASEPVRSVGDADRGPFDTLRRFMDRAPEIDGALVFEGETVVGGAHRRRIDAEWMKAIVRRRAPVLEMLLAGSGGEHELEELGYRLKSLVTGEEGMWCFGAELGRGRERTVWIFMGRDNAQGLGWAYLTSLSRQLSGLADGEGAAAE